MTISRYSYVSKFNNGKVISNSDCIEIIKTGMDSGQILFKVIELVGSQRIDTIAGEHYGDSSLWWIIAAASGIGWGLQLPPGTLIRIPTNLEQVFTML